MSFINKLADRPPNYHKTARMLPIFGGHPKSMKKLTLNKPAINHLVLCFMCKVNSFLINLLTCSCLKNAKGLKANLNLCRYRCLNSLNVNSKYLIQSAYLFLTRRGGNFTSRGTFPVSRGFTPNEAFTFIVLSEFRPEKCRWMYLFLTKAR